MKPSNFLSLTLLLLTGCVHHIHHDDEKALIISVDAKHLDYSSTEAFITSMRRNHGEVGHSWITIIDGNTVISGGHSGELGVTQPRYCEGIQNYIDYGYANPTSEQKKNPRHEPSPIRYLWEVQRDGFFQKGSGGHRATYSVKIPVDTPTIHKMKQFIAQYPFQEYSITRKQCTSFCVGIAALAGVHLEDRITLPIAQKVRFRNRQYQLWSDPAYSEITFPSPDVLEKSLKKYRGEQLSLGKQSQRHARQR